MQSSQEIDESAEKAEADTSDEAILEVARRRFDLAVEAERDLRDAALEDLKFGAGEQWHETEKKARLADDRPCLTINRIPQYVRQITNDQRQNRPSVKVSPVDDKADIETAKILQGIIRHIENASDADTAYDTAFDSAVRAGFGYFRIVTDYCDPMSFEQEIRIQRIRNRFSVYLDPSYQQPDGSDANWGFVFEDVAKDDYKVRYPKSDLASAADWSASEHGREKWAEAESVRVAEYFYKDFKEVEIALVENPETGEKLTVEADQLSEGMVVHARRKTLVPVVNWIKTNGIEILDRTDWLGKWIPIVPVLGEEIDIDGEKILAGIARHAKDSQRMVNYLKSNEAEVIALAPKTPWVGAEGQFEGHEKTWAMANKRSLAFLQYKPMSLLGQPVPPPQRNVYEPPVQAITQASMYAAEDMKATTGMYDAAMGNASNEKSGVAIQRRANQSQTSNFHFVDNLSKSIRHGGRILVDLIPKIYDTARAQRILGEDGTEEVVRINEMFEKGGKQISYSLGAGKYDVTVNTGPSYETKRQEAQAMQGELVRAYPQMMEAAGDIIVKAMDMPGADKIAERLKKMLPPQLADQEDQKDQQIPAQFKAQMDQMMQLNDQLTEQLNHKTQQIGTKAIEIESRERIEMQKLQVQLQIALAQLDAKDSLAMFQTEIAQLESRLNVLGQNEPIQTELQPEAGFDEAAPPIEQQPPTGGFSPGQPMEQMP